MKTPTQTPRKYITLNAIIAKNNLTLSYLPPAATKTETMNMTINNPLNIEKKIEATANKLGNQYHKIILISRKIA